MRRPIVMTSDGKVRPMEISDLKEVAERDERIRQLEALSATLAAQVDRQAKVVDASLTWAKCLRQSTAWTEPEAALEYTVREYQREMAQLAKEGE